MHRTGSSCSWSVTPVLRYVQRAGNIKVVEGDVQNNHSPPPRALAPRLYILQTAPCQFFFFLGPFQFLDIHACSGLKRLGGLRCPSLAVARVTACRELTELSLEAPTLSQLDVSGCVRLEPWDVRAGGGIPQLQVWDLVMLFFVFLFCAILRVFV